MKNLIVIAAVLTVTIISLTGYSYYLDEDIYSDIGYSENYRDSKAEILNSQLNEIQHKLERIRNRTTGNLAWELDSVILDIRNLKMNLYNGY